MRLSTSCLCRIPGSNPHALPDRDTPDREGGGFRLVDTCACLSGGFLDARLRTERIPDGSAVRRRDAAARQASDRGRNSFWHALLQAAFWPVPIALAAGKRWNSFATAALSVIGWIAVSFAVFGWEAWHAYLTAFFASGQISDYGLVH